MPSKRKITKRGKKRIEKEKTCRGLMKVGGVGGLVGSWKKKGGRCTRMWAEVVHSGVKFY